MPQPANGAGGEASSDELLGGRRACVRRHRGRRYSRAEKFSTQQSSLASSNEQSIVRLFVVSAAEC